MALKPSGRVCKIAEQIIEDLPSGLTFQFEARADGTTRLLIYGAVLPFGNRDIIFDANGREAGGGSFLGSVCRPSWLKAV